MALSLSVFALSIVLSNFSLVSEAEAKGPQLKNSRPEVKVMAQKSWQAFKKPSREDLKKALTPMQFQVTQQNGTERPFKNEYFDNKRAGIYVDIVSGEPLFSSLDKYDSGTGWPSFTKPLMPENILTREDRGLFSLRTEIRSKHADSHLGHVFDDGPMPTGLRYCMNSASLRFIPAEALKTEGYGEFADLFPEIRQQDSNPPSPTSENALQTSERALLAGGCFWGVEELFRKQPGVLETRVGYTGGKIPNPTYEIVKTGASGHAEAIEVIFDPKKTSYEAILKYFYKIHDPTTKNKQGNDVGPQYRSAIFYLNDSQRDSAERVTRQLEKSKAWRKPLVTEIVKATEFYSAEDYHQDYLQKNPRGYTCHFERDLDI